MESRAYDLTMLLLYDSMTIIFRHNIGMSCVINELASVEKYQPRGCRGDFFFKLEKFLYLNNDRFRKIRTNNNIYTYSTLSMLWHEF